MKATAFAPGHISGFFEPVYSQDMSRTGSRGAGINISLGAISKVFVSPSTLQSFEIFINGKKTNDNVTRLSLKYLFGDSPVKIVVKTKIDLPLGQGFGISAASALSATIAAAKTINLPSSEAIKSAHFAEVQLRTGLGDVIASSFGGIEIRKSAGLPPWGIIEHIPGNFELVLCIIGKKLDTKRVLTDSFKASKIADYGKLCTKKILDNPSVENLFTLSQIFTKKTELANPQVLKAIELANQYGMASMCMLGNSVFAMGKTDELFKTLSSFGKVYVCCVNESGARIIED
jgi:pantoate kinase